jgi:hypothetical protein
MENLLELKLSTVCLVVPFWVAVNYEIQYFILDFGNSNKSLYYKLHTFNDF